MVGETFGERVEALRKLTGLSARELDELAGLRANHTRKLETGGKRSPEARTVALIAEVFGVTTDWLYLGKGVQPTEKSARAAVARAQRVRMRTGTTG